MQQAIARVTVMNGAKNAPAWTEQTALVASLLAINALLFVAWLVFQATYVEEAILLPAPEHLNPYLIKISPYYDASGQKLAYLYFLAGTALLTLAAPALASLAPTFARRQVQLCTYAALSVAWTIAVVSSFDRQPRAGWCVAFGSAAVALAAVLARRLLQRRWQPFFRATCVVLLVGAIVPGLFFTFDLSRETSEVINFRDQHLSMIVGPADRLAAGDTSVLPHYGLLMPVLLAGFQRWVRPLDLGGYAAAFQVFSALYLVLAFLLYTWYCRGRAAACLVALLMVVPLYHFCHDNLLIPNQGAWRTFGLPLCLGVVYLVRAQPLHVAAAALGAAAGAALLMNVESGIAALAGVGAYLWFRYRFARRAGFLRRAGNAVICFALGMAVAGAGAWLAAGMLLGYWADGSDIQRWRDNTLFLFTNLSGGIPYLGYLLPVLMAMQAGVALVQTAFLPQERVDFRRSFRACAATMLLVWFLYYANRPHFWNLSSYYFLYGFFLIDLLHAVLVPLARAWRARKQHRPARAVLTFPCVMGSAALALCVMPAIAWVFSSEAGNMVDRTLTRHDHSKRMRISGVYLPGQLGTQIQQQADFLRRVSEDRPATYLALYSFLVANTAKVYAPLPGSGSVFDYADKTRYAELIAAMLRSDSDTIYFDASRSDLPPYTGFYWQVREDLRPHFRPAGIRDGWEVWERSARR